MWFASRDTNGLRWILYGKLHSLHTNLLLIFYSLRGSHTGSNLASVLHDCLVKFNLQTRLLTIVADNASNNDTLVDSLTRRIGTTGRFRGKVHRQRCFAHVLNLVMQASNHAQKKIVCTDANLGISPYFYQNQENQGFRGRGERVGRARTTSTSSRGRQ